MALAVEQALELVRHEPVEVQDEIAKILLDKLAISRTRRWSPAPLLCWKGPAVTGAGLQAPDTPPPESRQLQRVFKAIGRQQPEQQHHVEEALDLACLSLRLRALPEDVRVLVGCSMGRIARRLCRTFLNTHGPLRCGLRLDDTTALCTFHEQMTLGASAPHLSTATALVLGPHAPLPQDPNAVRTMSDLQAAAIRALPHLAALTLLQGAAPTDELLAALPPLAPRLTALTLPCLPQLSTSDCIRPLNLLRSLTLNPTPRAPGVPPPEPINPHALLGPLRRLRHLQALHLDLYPLEEAPPPNPDWLPALAALTHLTHVTVYPWMTPWDQAGLQALRHAWPSLASLSLHTSLPDGVAGAGVAHALAAALASRAALTALRLRVQAGGIALPLRQALSPLAGLADLEYEDAAWQDCPPGGAGCGAAEDILAAVAQRAALTRLVLRSPLQGTPGHDRGTDGSTTSSSIASHTGNGSVAAADITAGCGVGGSGTLGVAIPAVQRPLDRLAVLGSRLVTLEVGALSCALHGALLAAAGGAMPQLRVLRLRLIAPVAGHDPWDEACLSLVASLTHLRGLHLVDERHLPGCVAAAVAHLAGLESLSLVSLHRGTRDSPRLQGSHLKALTALTSLATLELVGFHEVRGRALTVLRRLPRLQALRLEGLPEVELFCHKLSAYLLPLPPALRLLHLHSVALSPEARDALATAAARQDCQMLVEHCWLRDSQ